MDERDHVFRARLGPLDRCAEGAACGRGNDVLGVHGGLRAEPAADPRADHAQVTRLHPEHARDRAVGRMRCLVRDPARHRARSITGLGEDAVVLHRRTGQPLTDHGHLGDLVGTLEGVDIRTVIGAEADVRPVLGEQDRRIGRQALGGGDDRVEPLVVDDHRVGGVDSRGLRCGDDGDQDVADEPHDVIGKDRAVHRGGHHREPLERRDAEVVAASVVHSLHAGHRLGIGHIDTDYIGVGLVGADERNVERARGRHVIEILPRTRQECGVLQPLNRVSENRSCSCHGEPFDDVR